jgi:hypothetical protein
LRAIEALIYERFAVPSPALSISRGVRARCVAEPLTKFSREMRVVAKAASIGNVAEWQTFVQRCPAIEKARGVIETQ